MNQAEVVDVYPHMCPPPPHFSDRTCTPAIIRWYKIHNYVTHKW